MRHRQKQLRYGVTSGLIAFVAGWAVIALLTPAGAFISIPRWKTTLWLYLGTHLVGLSSTYTGGLGLQTVQPLSLVSLPEYVFFIPPVAVGTAATYFCHQLKSHKLKHNVSNAFSVSKGYFLAAMAAMVISDIQPSITIVLTGALVIAGAFWLGSSFVGAVTRGLPIIGVASLGLMAAVGFLLLLGGVAVLNSVWYLIAVSFGSAGVVGVAFAVSRQLARKGGRNARFARIQGLQTLLADRWKEILVVVMVGGALVVGLLGK